MYGTIFHMQVKPGRVQEALELNQQWEREIKPTVDGALGSLVLQPDGQQDRLVGVAIFQSKDAYKANLNNPEQDQWYQQLRDCLEADPQWEDGEFMATGGLQGMAQAA